jgi:hypothetical protein
MGKAMVGISSPPGGMVSRRRTGKEEVLPAVPAMKMGNRATHFKTMITHFKTMILYAITASLDAGRAGRLSRQEFRKW